MLTINEFQTKEVVGVGDGKRLGAVVDLDVNLTTGKIDAIIITGGSKKPRFLGKDENIEIPWRNILKIGADVILVRYQDSPEQRGIESHSPR